MRAARLMIEALPALVGEQGVAFLAASSHLWGHQLHKSIRGHFLLTLPELARAKSSSSPKPFARSSVQPNRESSMNVPTATAISTSVKLACVLLFYSYKMSPSVPPRAGQRLQQIAVGSEVVFNPIQTGSRCPNIYFLQLYL